MIVYAYGKVKSTRGLIKVKEDKLLHALSQLNGSWDDEDTLASMPRFQGKGIASAIASGADIQAAIKKINSKQEFAVDGDNFDIYIAYSADAAKAGYGEPQSYDRSGTRGM